ncbi:hypothetical protein D3C80_1859910 [compost metagenome]
MKRFFLEGLSINAVPAIILRMLASKKSLYAISCFAFTFIDTEPGIIKSDVSCYAIGIAEEMSIALVVIRCPVIIGILRRQTGNGMTG